MSQKYKLLMSEESIFRTKKKSCLSAICLSVFALIIFTYSFRSGSSHYIHDYQFSDEGKLIECSNKSEVPADALPLFKNVKPVYIIDPIRKLSACLIPKNMSTLLNNLICFLLNPLFFREKYKTLNGVQLTDRTCDNQTKSFHRYRKIQEIRHGFDDWQHVVFVREPTERFLSGFMHICKTLNKCFDCGTDMLCVLENVYNMSTGYVDNIRTMPLHSLEAVHLTPQNWMCEFNGVLKDYTFIRYSVSDQAHMIGNLTNILRKANVDEHMIEEIRNELETESVSHSTRSDPQRDEYAKQLEQPEVKKWLRKIFYHDYKLFGFPLP